MTSAAAKEVLAELNREQRIVVESMIAGPIGYLESSLDDFDEDSDGESLANRCRTLLKMLREIKCDS